MKKVINFLLGFTVFILLISGCATTKGYEQRVESWIGSSEARLVRGWGVPAQVFNSGESRYFVYNSSRNVYLPGTSPTYTTAIYGNTAYTTSYGGSAPKNLHFNCSTTFEIKNSKIVSWRFKGNDCTAPELSSNQAKNVNNEIIRLTKQEISKTLPQKVDRYTTFTKIQSKNNTLIYTFELITGNKSDETIKREDKSRMKQAVTAGICKSAKKFLERGINITYLYTSTKSKEKLFQFDVSKTSCH